MGISSSIESLLHAISLEEVEERVYPPEVLDRLRANWNTLVPPNDPFGFDPDMARRALVVTYAIYHYYFRAESFGHENVPAAPAVFVANHSGQLPFDGMALVTDMVTAHEPPRMLRSLVEWSVPRMPFVGMLYAKIGQVVGTPENASLLLEQGQSLLVFPEGVRGIVKPFSQRYRLQRFGFGFLRIALASSVPVVPCAVIGAEEQAPGVDIKPLARLLGLPAFPVTFVPPFIPIVPLPVKYRIYYGEPLMFHGDPDAPVETLRPMVEEVRTAVASLIARGLRERENIF